MTRIHPIGPLLNEGFCSQSVINLAVIFEVCMVRLFAGWRMLHCGAADFTDD